MKKLKLTILSSKKLTIKQKLEFSELISRHNYKTRFLGSNLEVDFREIKPTYRGKVINGKIILPKEILKHLNFTVGVGGNLYIIPISDRSMIIKKGV